MITTTHALLAREAVVLAAGEDARMLPPAREDLISQIEALPAASPLLAAVGDEPGVYLVGGAVRDLLRHGGTGQAGAPGAGDLDLVAEGDVAALAARLGGRYLVHERFGTASVLLDGHRYDFATARSETYPEPGALPEVSPAPLSEDLQRRDFTVNAIAVTLGGPRAGELTAVPGALDDLSAGWLRVLHDQSFIDDPTRLIRLARYASRLGFVPEPVTGELARAAVAGGALATISGSRIGAELRLLACEDDPVAALAGLAELGIDRAIHPRLGIADTELARRALALLPTDGRRQVLVLALALAEVAPSELASLLDDLAFDAETRDGIVAVVSGVQRTAAALTDTRRPSEVDAAVARGSLELVAFAGALGPQEQAREWLEGLRLVRLEIDGSDLIAAGVPEGPEVGRGLRAARAAKLDGRVSSRESQLAEALRAARG